MTNMFSEIYENLKTEDPSLYNKGLEDGLWVVAKMLRMAGCGHVHGRDSDPYWVKEVVKELRNL